MKFPMSLPKVLSVQDGEFQFEVDISEISDDRGSGVYTVILLGYWGHEFTDLSQYSLFVD